MRTRRFDRIGNGGLTFTELGLGTAPFGNLYKAITEAEADAVLEAAWTSGVRYIDTAPQYGYGLSETRLNRFLRGVKRDDYVISTKVGRLLKACPPAERSGQGKFFDTPSRREVFDYSYDGVMRSFEASLERLGLDRVDILFAHDLDVFTHGSQAALDERLEAFMRSGYYALLSLRDQGAIRAFGAGVNEWQSCETMARRGDFDLFLLAGRYTLLEQQALDSFLPLCEARGIGIVLGGPYNSGLLATGPRPGAFYNYNPAPAEILDRTGRLQAVCQRHGVRLIEAALRFPLAHPAVVSVIPGGQSAAEVRGNLDILGATIPDALWADLKREGLLAPNAPVPGEARS
ncbi:pyridoxal 4-dehydrogenase [Prosthecomicrobium hirschii]|uniref:Pyridoxal 4-dehydrogenase n=1 Tax=Prosthecodimorpha hirschii TaxID=665126 RepID=A0A0P6W9A7_9HYPH|nr:aldo/keto reductase [Prosthecomicrobium hirschii]KPL50941.1 pyridoxal 4-dehydrogenase [Prosthecomicrobium hirschii]TPQ52279.1 aldo/keto reductase [Prosthecomicrobium hirschii]